MEGNFLLLLYIQTMSCLPQQDKIKTLHSGRRINYFGVLRWVSTLGVQGWLNQLAASSQFLFRLFNQFIKKALPHLFTITVPLPFFPLLIKSSKNSSAFVSQTVWIHLISHHTNSSIFVSIEALMTPSIIIYFTLSVSNKKYPQPPFSVILLRLLTVWIIGYGLKNTGSGTSLFNGSNLNSQVWHSSQKLRIWRAACVSRGPTGVNAGSYLVPSLHQWSQRRHSHFRLRLWKSNLTRKISTVLSTVSTWFFSNDLDVNSSKTYYMPPWYYEGNCDMSLGLLASFPNPQPITGTQSPQISPTNEINWIGNLISSNWNLVTIQQSL